MSKQTAVDLIFENFNLLSDADFKSWMLNNHDELKQMEKEQQKYFFDCGRQYQLNGEGTFTQVYNETYGGQDE